MGWLNDRLGINSKNIGGLAMAALPFIPGVGGVAGIAGAMGGLMGGGSGGSSGGGQSDLEKILGLYGAYQNLQGGKKAEGNANRLMGLQEQQLMGALGAQGQLQGLLGGAGGLASMLLPQYQQFLSTPLDPTKGMYRSMLESAGNQANSQVGSIMNDYASRGLLGGNTGLAGAIANARLGVARSANQAAHQAALQGRQQRFAELQGGMQGMHGLYSLATNPSATSSLGGLAGMYQSKSDAFGDALGSLGGLMGRESARGATAGQGNLNTNNARQPVQYNNPWDPESFTPLFKGRPFNPLQQSRI